MKLEASLILPLLPLLPLLLVSAESFVLRKHTDLMQPSPNGKLRVEHRKSSPTYSTETTVFPLNPRSLSEPEADELCLSDAFAPTIENWWESGATEWVKSYTLANADSLRFKELGLINHLAEVYLKKTNFKCGIDTPHRCAVECQEVVTRVEDQEDARVVWFVLKSAGHVAEVTKVVHDTLTAAQINMAEMIPIIGKTFFWTAGFDDHMWAVILTHTINTLSSLFMNFFPMLRGFMHINASLEALASAAVASYMDANVALQEAQKQMSAFADIEDYDNDANVKAAELAAEKRNRMERRCRNMVNTVKAARLGVTDMIIGQIGQGIGRAFGRANWEMNYHGKHSGSEWTREGNELGLEAFIRSSCMRARESLKKGTEIILNGAMVEADGSSLFSNFTMGGNFLPDINGDAAKWRDSGIEEKITRGLMLKTLNAALNSQQVYITCTRDYRRTFTSYQPSVESKPPAGTCKRDNSGPQDFKACINGYACYLYKWNSRGWAPSWRNEKIFGSDIIDEEPWNVNITGIITSSVRAYSDGIRGYGGRDMSAFGRGIFDSLGDNHTVESLWDPTTPGMFTVPVCFSKYNWATILDGYRFPQNGIFDTQPRNSIKNLPCNCGPWGRDTETVWKEVGLWNADMGKDRKYFNDYTASKCGYQIYDKIKDPVERYVAFCRVYVHGRMKDRIRYVGRDWQCDIVIDVLEKLGYPDVWQLAPEVYHVIYCKVIRHPGARMCRGYKELPLGVLLNQLGVSVSGIGGGEEKEVEVEVVEVEVVEGGNEPAGGNG